MFSFRGNFLEMMKHSTATTEIPEYVIRKARHYWKVYAMTGYEAAVTCHQDIAAGKL